VGEILVNPSSNVLIPMKVRVLIEDVEQGTHPIHFDVQAKEMPQNAPEILRVRDEKSSFIVPR
jgi:hypothetical protein